MPKTALIASLEDGDASILIDINHNSVPQDAVHFITAALEC
jgi:hypothetical protein